MTERRLVSITVPAVLLGLSLSYVGTLGILGADFGRHWDEINIVRSVSDTFETGRPLPGWYAYPSFSYAVALLTAVPPATAHALSTAPDAGPERVASYLTSPSYLLLLRSVFALLSLCAGLAAYRVARVLSGSAWTGLFAALVLLTSWEFLYQARWVAPDALLAALVASTMASQQRIMASETPGQARFWIVVSAVGVGLCLGTKYPGGMVLAPLLVAVGLTPATTLRRRYPMMAASLLIAVTAFVLTTPGALLEHEAFLHDVRAEIEHYSTWHGGYTVSAGPQHLCRMLTYLVAVAPSKSIVVAAAISALALVGVVDLTRTRPKVAVWLMALPILYVGYMSLHRVLIVRNYLLLLPFMAVLASLGLNTLSRYAATRRPLRLLIPGMAAAAILYNLSAATISSLSIYATNARTPEEALADHMAGAPDTVFGLSPRGAALIETVQTSRYPNVTDQLERADRVVFLSSEVTDWTLYAANVPGRYCTVWSSMDEVNWDYYPTWSAHWRILDVSTEDAALADLVRHVNETQPRRR